MKVGQLKQILSNFKLSSQVQGKKKKKDIKNVLVSKIIDKVKSIILSNSESFEEEDSSECDNDCTPDENDQEYLESVFKSFNFNLTQEQVLSTFINHHIILT